MQLMKLVRFIAMVTHGPRLLIMSTEGGNDAERLEKAR